MSDTKDIDQSYDIAIIGMVGRFPGADGLDQFWHNLCNGVESITFFNDQELLAAGADPEALNHPNYVKANAIVADIDCFDARFFGFNPHEAEITDPQHRVFLECAWHALENAGYDAEQYDGRIGLYAGVSASTYLLNNLYTGQDFGRMAGYQIMIGNDKDFLATQVSYRLNLKGPSVVVQTACSTSLVATHLACQALLNRECDMALAGGVALRVPQTTGYFYEEGGIASPDGHCRPFDADAQGTLSGNGVGIVVLKRLADALKDRDTLWAIIKGSAINNDGAAKIGYTAPSEEGQVEVITEALAVADVNPETITYVETHGTGTALGDPIEVAALTQAFRTETSASGFCALGSVKSNIGHLDAAAGVTGLIKTALALKHKQMPPSLHFTKPNLKIDFEHSPFYVNTTLRDWKTKDGQPRRAGVSSFGIGGTNAHLVLEEAPPLAPADAGWPGQLLIWSAKTKEALEEATANLAAHLERHPHLNLADVAFTLQVGRHPFDHRRMLICSDMEDAVTTLREDDPKRIFTSFEQARHRPVFLMFPGQGAQYVNMGHGLYETEPVFRATVNHCADVLRPHLGLNVLDILYPKEESAAERLDQTAITQPALFVIEYALAKLWQAWGLQPAGMIGHSIGEYVAACLAGVFALEDALALVAQRGRLIQQLPAGSMLGVSLSEAELLPLLAPSLSLAAVNGPTLCTVSGTAVAIDALQAQLEARGVGCQRLHTSHAFHSAMMDPILDAFAACVKRSAPNPPAIPFVSNVTGTWITLEEATDPHYWAKHLRQTVRFADGIETLLMEPDQVLLEVGPGRTLSTFARQQSAQTIYPSMRHPHDTQTDRLFLLTTLGRLWLSSLEINWRAFYGDERRQRVPLPPYPFERQRYWINPGKGSRPSSLSKNPNIAEWFYIPSWKRTMPPTGEPQEIKCWLLFDGGDSLSDLLARQLEARGDQVIKVMAGEQFAAKDGVYMLRPACASDYEALMASLRERHQSPTGIAHLWNLASPDSAEQTLQRSFFSLLFLAQSLDKQGFEKLHLAVVSSNVHKVVGTELVQPEKATLLGVCRVVPQEMPHISCRNIDIVLPTAGLDQEARIAEQLVAELDWGTSDPVIAYRGCNRWVQSFEPTPLTALTVPMARKLRERGVYLVTGGLGGMGLALADYLAKTVHAKLVLTSRSHFPQPEDWDEWLATHDPQDRTSARIRAIQDLEALGAEVLAVQADVTNQPQMERVIRAACERFGAIHGVIHAAGLPGGGTIQLKTKEAAEAVLAPKVPGTRVLEAVLGNIPLDFFILCSSVTALTGGLGQLDYCAANAFLDAFAHARDGSGVVVSINWDTWGEVGMAVNTPLSYGSATRLPLPFSTTNVNHPLVTGVHQETAKQRVYGAVLSPAEHWVLSEHILMGLPTLPGTAYLELARAAFADRAPGARLEIREAVFPTPLMVGRNDHKRVHIILGERADGFDFQIKSEAGISASGEPLWQTHAIGQLGYLDAAPPQCDLKAIQARCNVSQVVAAGAEFNVAGLKFGPRWTSSLKRVDIGHNEGIALIELSHEFAPDMEGLKLHPALLDIATSFGVSAFSAGHLYVPLSFERVRVYADLPARFYSHVRLKPGIAAGGETLAFQVTLIDERGWLVVDIGEFTARRVDEAAASRLESSRDAKTRPPAAAPYQRDFSQAILPDEGSEVFQRILARNRLPQIAVCTRPLAALIQETVELTPARLLDNASHVGTPGEKHPRPTLQTPYVAPRNDLEAQLVIIWQQLLGIAPVGVHDNLFELGGHSLLATQIMSQVRDRFAVELPVRRFFELPTIAELAQAIEEQRGDSVPVEEHTLAIKPAKRDGALPLSFAQQRLWFLDQLEPASSAYNIYTSVRLTGMLNVKALEQSINHVVQRHEILRTSFATLEDRPVQVIALALEIALPIIDLDEFPKAEQDTHVRRLAIKEARRPFDLARGPLVRANLLRLGAKEHILLLTMHHIVSDDWSLGLVTEEITALYQAFAAGRPSPLPQLPIQYADFAIWQQQWLQGEVVQTQIAYWKQQLAGAPPALELATDLPRPPIQTFQGARQLVVLPQALSGALRALSQKKGITLFMVLLAAFKTLLYRYTGQADIVVGSPIAGRNRTELEKLVGFFVNTLALRTRISGDITFDELLERVREVTLGAYAHQDLPFERLVEELQPERNLSRSPLFQVLFVLQNSPAPPLELRGPTLESLEFHSETAKFDLGLGVIDLPQLVVTLEYNTDLFEAATASRMLRHFQALLEGIVTNPEQRLADWALLTADERQQMLVEWNATQADYARHACIHTLVEAQAGQTPDAVAVVYGEQHLTYQEMDRRANQLARHLQALGLRSETLVAVCVERSLEMVVGLLGVLKAGGAYLPLDVAHPQERLAFVLADTLASVLLTQTHLLSALPEHTAQVVCLDAEWATIARQPFTAPPAGVTSDCLAYTIYTSGSTGKPKGVQIEQRAVVNVLDSMRRQPGLAAQDILLAVTTLAFDIAGLELFLPLAVGARLVLVGPAVSADGQQLVAALAAHCVTAMQATPATWRLLLAAGWKGSVGKVLCGGEALSPELAAQLVTRSDALWNMYGPTETTIWSCLHKLESAAGPVAIGRPIANTEVYLLDASMQPVPVGVPGELYIGGDGVARGYFQQPGLTAERFVPNPFASPLYSPRLRGEIEGGTRLPATADAGGGSRLYKTGDLARYWPGGEIEFLGRTDFQVKLRGFRIELGEIESRLAQHPAVGAAVVVAQRDGPAGDQRLVAYVVPGAMQKPTVNDLRDYLKEKLPDYMLPSAFVMIEALPLTPSGKIDRRALPAPDRSQPEKTFAPPRTPTEEVLARIWGLVLGLERVGIYDNFFDLGGHSLLATQIISQVRQAFGLELPLQIFFRAPTVEGLALAIEDALGKKSAATTVAIGFEEGES